MLCTVVSLTEREENFSLEGDRGKVRAPHPAALGSNRVVSIFSKKNKLNVRSWQKGKTTGA